MGIEEAPSGFLLTSVEQTSRRIKFQELVLLLVRIAVLVLLAVGLAPPASTSRGSAWRSSGHRRARRT